MQMRIDPNLGLVAVRQSDEQTMKAEACLRSALLPRARELAGESLRRREGREPVAVNSPLGAQPREKRDPLKSPSFLRGGAKLGKAATTPRNAPCPCGSGRKFKACCGA